VGENLWIAVDCQWRRWRFVSVRRIRKVGEKKGGDGEERENNNILMK
jgi:hypothetical protein